MAAASKAKPSTRKGLMLADTSALTARQREIYEFIRDKICERGYGPTIREIGDYCEITSPNGVMCHLKALQKKGFITREPNLSRAIQLTEETPILPIRIGEKGIGNGVANAELLGQIVDIGHLFKGTAGHVVLNGAMTNIHIPSGVTVLTDPNATVGICYLDKQRVVHTEPGKGRVAIIGIALPQIPTRKTAHARTTKKS